MPGKLTHHPFPAASLTEISTIILCTCFPMLPRFTQLILRRKTTRLSERSTMPCGRRDRIRHRGGGEGESFEVLHDQSSASGMRGAGTEEVHLPLEDRGRKDGVGRDRQVVDRWG